MKEKPAATVIGSLLVLAMSTISPAAISADSADKTGTNPVNFTNDFRVYNEYIWLDTAGDGFNNVSTIEYRTPFADGKWQFRARVRGASMEADVNNDGVDSDSLMLS